MTDSIPVNNDNLNQQKQQQKQLRQKVKDNESEILKQLSEDMPLPSHPHNLLYPIPKDRQLIVGKYSSSHNQSQGESQKISNENLFKRVKSQKSEEQNNNQQMKNKQSQQNALEQKVSKLQQLVQSLMNPRENKQVKEVQIQVTPKSVKKNINDMLIQTSQIYQKPPLQDHRIILQLSRPERKVQYASNVFGLTIGEMLAPDFFGEKERELRQKKKLIEQITNLKMRVQVLEFENKSLKDNSIHRDSLFFDNPKSSRASLLSQNQNLNLSPKSKMQFCGRIIKRSQVMPQIQDQQGFEEASEKSSSIQCKQKEFQRFPKQNSEIQQKNNIKTKSFSKRKVSTVQKSQLPIKKQESLSSELKHIPFNTIDKMEGISQNLISRNKINEEQKNSRKNFRVSTPSRPRYNKQEKQRQNTPVHKQTLEFNPEHQAFVIIESKQTQENKQSYIQITQNFKFPILPKPPLKSDGQEQLVEIAKQTFNLFGVSIDQSQILIIKKYKNCILISANQMHSILWHFDGSKFYFGGWKVENNKQADKFGPGVEFSAEKYYFKGQFKQGKRNGQGIMKSIGQHKFIYEGQWKNSLKNGFGKQTEQNGTVYEGQWKDGKKQGYGKLFTKQNEYYEGHFVRGVKNGQGQEHFKNGDMYKGNYYNGKFHGRGYYQWNKGANYLGQFQNGSRNGSGIWKANINNENCDIYQGQYKNDKKHGNGVYKWANGSIYQGRFENDLKHGEGLIRNQNGNIMKFIWKNGEVVQKLGVQTSKNEKHHDKNDELNNSNNQEQLNSLSNTFQRSKPVHFHQKEQKISYNSKPLDLEKGNILQLNSFQYQEKLTKRPHSNTRPQTGDKRTKKKSGDLQRYKQYERQLDLGSETSLKTPSVQKIHSKARTLINQKLYNTSSNKQAKISINKSSKGKKLNVEAPLDPPYRAMRTSQHINLI